MTPTPITHHHDGHGLNESIAIGCDERDPDNGGASHVYTLLMPATEEYIKAYRRGGGGTHHPGHYVGRLTFQHGPRDEPGSTRGITDAALLAIVLDRYEGFQAGPYACDDNAAVIAHLKAALSRMKHRAAERAHRGVLGRNEK